VFIQLVSFSDDAHLKKLIKTELKQTDHAKHIFKNSLITSRIYLTSGGTIEKYKTRYQIVYVTCGDRIQV